MSCEGYDCSTLIGNWFEERQTMKQESKKNPDFRIKRDGNDIFYETGNGIKQLPKFKRKPKWNTKPVVVDHGFVNFSSKIFPKTIFLLITNIFLKRNYTPLAQESFRKQLLDNYYNQKNLKPLKKTPSSVSRAERTSENMQTKGERDFKMLNESNAHQSLAKREYPMNTSDFFSTLKRHEKNHKRM